MTAKKVNSRIVNHWEEIVTGSQEIEGFIEIVGVNILENWHLLGMNLFIDSHNDHEESKPLLVPEWVAGS